MDKSCEATVRAEKLKTTLSLFEDTTDETELSNLCKELVNIINVGGEDERKEALIEAAQILVDDISVETGAEIFFSLCKEIGKLDVIPLIAEIISEPADWFYEVTKTDIMTVSFCRDLIAAAGSNTRSLKVVMDILFDLVPDDTVMKVFPDLLAVVNKRWDDEELVHWTLELYVHTLNNYDQCQERDLMMECKLLTSVSNLLSLLFSKNPNSMDLDRILDDFPRGLTWSDPMCCLLAEAACFTVSLVFNSTDFLESLKVMRVIFPIVSNVLDYIAQNYVTMMKLPSTAEFIKSTVNFVYRFLSPVLKDSKSNSGAEKAMKLFISSRLMERSLTLLEKSTRENVCCRGVEGSCDLIQDCFLFWGVENAVLLSVKNRTSGLSIKEGAELLKLIKRVLDNEKIFREDDDGLDLAYSDACILIVEEIFLLGPEELRQYMCEPEDSVLPSIIDFATRHPSSLKIACKVILTIERKCGIEELFCHLISLPSIWLSHFLANKELIKCSMKLKVRHIICIQDEVGMDNMILISTINILKRMILSVKLPELQEMEARFNVVELIMKVFKMTKNPDLFGALMVILNFAIDMHQLNLLNKEKLLGILPDVWKKIKMSEFVEENVVRFTYKTSLLIPDLHELNYSDFMPIVLDDAKAIRCVKPQNPGLFRLIWDLSKHRKHKQLSKKLVQLSADKTVEYASPGNHELAGIFKLISDIIIEYLENDPPFDTKYLIDLTHCMVAIARLSSLDEELYVLEDMVSPAMWLLEKQHDEKIVANVKEFIRILH